MKNFKSLMIAGLLVCAFAVAAYAQNPTSFTDEQRAEYAKRYTDYETKVMPLHDKLMAKMMELRAVENLPTATVADIQKIVGEIATLKEQMRKEQQTFNAELAKAGLPQHQGGYHGYGRGGHDGYHKGGMMGGRGMMMEGGMMGGRGMMMEGGMMGGRGPIDCPNMGYNR